MYEGPCLYVIRVMCEQYIGLCDKNDLKMKTREASCILCVQLHWNTFLFMMMSMDVIKNQKRRFESKN